MKNRPDIINREKASSHPTRPGRFYSATVSSVTAQGLVNINIPSLGIGVGPVLPLGTTALNKCSPGDTVQCTFTDEFFTNVIVFGPTKIKPDVFASKELFEDLVTRVDDLEAQVNALESAFNGHSH
jgi:hypothetical protein